MANKTVTITEPTASDIQAITVIYDGSGSPVSVEVSCAVQTSDGEVMHYGGCSTVPADYTAAEQAAFASAPTTAAAKFSELKSFPTV